MLVTALMTLVAIGVAVVGQRAYAQTELATIESNIRSVDADIQGLTSRIASEERELSSPGTKNNPALSAQVRERIETDERTLQTLRGRLDQLERERQSLAAPSRTLPVNSTATTQPSWLPSWLNTPTGWSAAAALITAIAGVIGLFLRR